MDTKWLKILVKIVLWCMMGNDIRGPLEMPREYAARLKRINRERKAGAKQAKIDAAPERARMEKVAIKEKRSKKEKVGILVPSCTNITEDIKYDPYVENFSIGTGGGVGVWDEESYSEFPMVIRGLSGKAQNAIIHCRETDTEFFYIDTGYMLPGMKKDYHRITKNNVQHLGPIKERPSDRLEKLGFAPREMIPNNSGGNVLICPPSLKAMKFYGENLDEWMEQTIAEIKKHTDRPIETRLKPARRDRITNDTIYSALDKAYCLVTFNSIAATESLLHGVPAIALAPNNSARMLCNTSISEIEDLNRPSMDEVWAFAAHLSYCQFTSDEMKSGFAFNTINESD